MKILIDEQLPTKLKNIFSEIGYEVFTVRDMKWLGTKNGKLLELMKNNNFTLLLTNDKNINYQQNIDKLKVSILNINAKTNRIEDVLEIKKAIISKLQEIQIHLSNNKISYYLV